MRMACVAIAGFIARSWLATDLQSLGGYYGASRRLPAAIRRLAFGENEPATTTMERDFCRFGAHGVVEFLVAVAVADRCAL